VDYESEPVYFRRTKKQRRATNQNYGERKDFGLKALQNLTRRGKKMRKGREGTLLTQVLAGEEGESLN